VDDVTVQNNLLAGEDSKGGLESYGFWCLVGGYHCLGVHNVFIFRVASFHYRSNIILVSVSLLNNCCCSLL
jgi:hypothetical protein